MNRRGGIGVYGPRIPEPRKPRLQVVRASEPRFHAIASQWAWVLLILLFMVTLWRVTALLPG